MGNSVTVLESGIDWVSATTSTEAKTRKLMDLGQELLGLERSWGNGMHMFNWYGYALESCGSVRCGSRPDGGFLQIAGYAANAHGVDVIRIAERVTRLDVQVTARVEPQTGGIASSYYRAWQSKGEGPSRMKQCTLIQSGQAGSTLYVGSAKSQSMGRIYNKWAQSEQAEYAGCWRYEVQLRDAAANKVSDAFMHAELKAPWTVAFVATWFKDREFPPVFSTDTETRYRIPRRPTTDVARKLQWLRIAVRPTLAFLIDMDYGESMLDALGLLAVVDPTSLPGTGYVYSGNDDLDDDVPEVDTEVVS